MRFQLVYPVIKAPDIRHHRPHLCLNDMRLFPHPGILEDSPNRVQRCHQRGRRDDPDPLLPGLFNHLGQIGMKFRIDRFRRQKHQR